MNTPEMDALDAKFEAKLEQVLALCKTPAADEDQSVRDFMYGACKWQEMTAKEIAAEWDAGYVDAETTWDAIQHAQDYR